MSSEFEGSNTDKPVRLSAKSFSAVNELVHDFRVRGKKQVIDILVQFALTPDGKDAIARFISVGGAYPT